MSLRAFTIMGKSISLVVSLFFPLLAFAQAADTTAAPTLLSLEDAIRVALSENVSVKVADKEVERTGYARKGTYASLLPQVSGSGSYQRTIKKQVMYMDFDIGGSEGGSGGGSSAGFEVGRWNTWSAGITASMPIINVQLWENLRVSGQSVELAVEKARSSRLEAVNQVKQAYFS